MAKAFTMVLKHLAWSLPWPQGPRWELEVFTMAKAFAKVFAMVLRLSPWSLPLPKALAGSWRCSLWPRPSPWS